jgi:flavin reductase (DIM6/NTAB) family NADH-FMN oxidoreductase RutF
MSEPADFSALGRQQFRRYFQPSRVVIGLWPAPTESGVNAITLCFAMYCSYKPPMMAVAIHRDAATYGLVELAKEFVLAVPGPSLVREAMAFGTTSMREVDKVAMHRLVLQPSHVVAVPSISKAIANIELLTHAQIDTGDHKLVVGRVARFGVNRALKESPLVSLGPETHGFRVLRRDGIHRLGIVGE